MTTSAVQICLSRTFPACFHLGLSTTTWIMQALYFLIHGLMYVAYTSNIRLAPTLSTVQEGVLILQHQGPSLSMNGMSPYLVLLSAHCCKASLKISWDRRCANSKTRILDSVSPFTSSLIT